MKTPLFILGLAGMARAVAAQEAAPAQPIGAHVLSLGIYGLSANIGLQYEQRLSRHFSLSARGTRYFSVDYPGYQAMLAARVYFRPLAPTGLYLQVQAGAFSHNAHVVSDYPGATPVTSATKIKGHGGGLGLGYQWRFSQHFVFDAGLGLRFYPHNLGEMCDCYYVGNWYNVGQPGSVFDGQFSLGYAF